MAIPEAPVLPAGQRTFLVDDFVRVVPGVYATSERYLASEYLHQPHGLGDELGRKAPLGWLEPVPGDQGP